MNNSQSVDTRFPYPTPKIARIKDYKLGLLRWLLILIITIYVVGFQILWRGNHLETTDLTGVSQLQLDHPTRNYCDPVNIECMQNFTSLFKLPYCAQSPQSGSIKLPCEYWDAQSLQQLTDQGLMIPTHVSTFWQKPACKPDVSNSWACKGWLYHFLDRHGQIQMKRATASPVHDIFVADIERYTLTIDHSVRSPFGARYYASRMIGYVLDCDHEHQSDSGCVPRPIQCGSSDCIDRPQSASMSGTAQFQLKFRGDRRSLTLAETQSENAQSPPTSHHPLDVKSMTNSIVAPGRARHLQSSGVASIAQGDIFTIGKLLHAANVSLDAARHDVPSWVGGSYRSSGFVLVIRVHYSNIESWLGMKVLPWKPEGPTMHYTYRVTKHASHDDFQFDKVFPGGPNEPNNSRILKEYNGIRVLVEQSGTMAVWDNIQLLLILTTTLALTVVSSCITDTVALYCLPNSDEYWAIKYERPRTRKPVRRPVDGTIPEEPETEEGGTDNVMRYSSITM